ncbi:MAG: hypothetical protein IKV03_06490 [Alphaproteobacteria bacterium]|nr:hypothetical protein [Alphaproteobacteria bacterium]
MTKKEQPKKTTKTTKTTKTETKRNLSFWPANTSREDKVSLLSFCLGMIVMTCFFVLDLQIRDNFQKQDSNSYLKLLTRQMQMEQRTRHHFPHCNCKQATCPAAKINKPTLKCPPVWQRQVIFNPLEYAPYDAQGTLTISGNIYHSLPKGVKYHIEKADVFVNPKTSYSDEWWTKHWTGSYGISKVDERALKYNKAGTVQTNGDFSITNLPSGTYYVGATACVSKKAGTPCRNIRWGTEVSINEDTKVTLNKVFTKRKQRPRK